MTETKDHRFPERLQQLRAIFGDVTEKQLVVMLMIFAMLGQAGCNWGEANVLFSEVMVLYGEGDISLGNAVDQVVDTVKSAMDKDPDLHE